MIAKHVSLLIVLISPLWLSATLALATEKVDLVRVEKSQRKMQLLSGGSVLKEYKIALGARPVGHKRWEGDERTPEGRYVLDWRNPKSMAHKSIHISYPNTQDKAAAKSMGVSPGGAIMIHGAVNGYGWWDGCFNLSTGQTGA
jgi:murein L,D-transpeptidase YafK